MKYQLNPLSESLDDLLHQAEFMANWAMNSRLSPEQIENEFDILTAEIWDIQEQVKALNESSQDNQKAGEI
ncbi:hypothetical protein ENHAE0001_1566 [Enhydrobacter aerosaccus SK60]|mgnify:CR=1 FL=1|nr:hypothetical protein [Moraxella sp. CTOTU47579]EEV23925.1 hypothetical protein ENHAE0001_1566 [Enhydrobacter aerosaccus SK60]